LQDLEEEGSTKLQNVDSYLSVDRM